MLATAIKTIRDLGRPLDVLLFALGGVLGACLPFLFHVIAGFFFLPLPKEQWDTDVEFTTVRTIFMTAGGLSVVLPAIASGLCLRGSTRARFVCAVFFAGQAAGALATTISLYPFTLH